jgi:segregation and condensation protein A
LILREEVDLLEVDLAEIVISYVDHLERRAELDLEATTEFLVLIAALLELKSRLMLPGEEVDEFELDPADAAEELLARLLDAHRYRDAAADLRARLQGQEGYRFRSAPLPPELRRAALGEASQAYQPAVLTEAMSGLLRVPEPLDTRHMVASRVTVADRLARLRALLRRGTFSFEEAVERADRVTVAVTIYALLELYKQGELTWSQEEPFGEITIMRSSNQLAEVAG